MSASLQLDPGTAEALFFIRAVTQLCLRQTTCLKRAAAKTVPGRQSCSVQRSTAALPRLSTGRGRCGGGRHRLIRVSQPELHQDAVEHLPEVRWGAAAPAAEPPAGGGLTCHGVRA